MHHIFKVEIEFIADQQADEAFYLLREALQAAMDRLKASEAQHPHYYILREADA
jgi:hypothetical protein